MARFVFESGLHQEDPAPPVREPAGDKAAQTRQVSDLAFVTRGGLPHRAKAFINVWFLLCRGGNKDLVVKVEPKLESQTFLQPRIRNLLRAKHYLLPCNTYLLQARRPSLFPEHRDRKLAAHQVMKTKTIKKIRIKKQYIRQD